MKIDQVAIQLYTLRATCQTAQDLASTLKRVREIGYRAAQLSAVGPIPPEEIRAIAEGEGVVLCATHEPSKTILENPQAVVDRLETLGIRYTACPNAGGLDLGAPGVLDQFIRQLDAAGEVLRKGGKVLTYHNHAVEFARVDNKVILERIYGETRPENLMSEIDTYWVQYGGASPVEWLRKLEGRAPLLHLKDYAIGLDNTPYYTEIGNGNLNFKAIIEAAEAGGCEWFIVEQDTCPGDPFDSIRQSFDTIASTLVTS